MLLAQQADQDALESKNNDLSTAYADKSKAFQRSQKLYQSLKQQVMASQVAVAAGDEAEHTVQTARGNRFVDRMPGVKTGTRVYTHPSAMQQHGGNVSHIRQGSGSSGSSGQQRGGVGLGLAPTYTSQLQGRGLNLRAHTGRKSMTSCFWFKLDHANLVQDPHSSEHHVKVVYLYLVEHVKVPFSKRALGHHTKPHL